MEFIDRYRLLTWPETLDLIKDYQTTGSKAARDAVINHNLRLVLKIAKDYQKRAKANDPYWLDDYFNEGVIGLMTALDKFKPEKGYRFTTYATWWIKQTMERFNSQHTSKVRVPEHSRELQATIKKLGTDDVETIMTATGCTKEKVELALKWRKDAVSYDMAAKNMKGNKSEDWLNDIPGDLQTPEDYTEEIEKQETIKALLKQLDEFNRDHPLRRDSRVNGVEIIKYRFGFITGKPETLEFIAELFGLSKERVRQVCSHQLRLAKRFAEKLQISHNV